MPDVSTSSARGARVAFVLKGYPRLSESFIAQEIRGLEQRGLDIEIVSLRHPTDPDRHPVHAEITAPVTYLPEYLHHEPLRVLAGWRAARRLPGFARAFAIWRADLRRDRSRNRVRRFGQAVTLAAELGGRIAHLHAHFLHTPSSVTRYAAVMLGIGWTSSSHARDIWTSPAWELREKLNDCEWGVTCTAVNHAHLNTLAETPDERVELLYHGLDLGRFKPFQRVHNTSDGTDPAHPVELLSVGRAVEKKGYDDLLAALDLVDPALEWRLTHIGGGPMLKTLRADAARRGLEPRIRWRGALAQGVVIDAYRNSDVFVLASRIASDGDRDGLPNVLVEAQSQGLAALATRVSAIPELIVSDRNGLLVEPGDPVALGRALETLIRTPALRARLGDEGARLVHAEFSMERGLDRLMAKFSATLGRRQTPAAGPGDAQDADGSGRALPDTAHANG